MTHAGGAAGVSRDHQHDRAAMIGCLCRSHLCRSRCSRYWMRSGGVLPPARHSRAHRFFASARWSLDQVSLTMLGLVVGWITRTDAPLLVAVDDTLFRRSRRRVHGAFWAYDGSRSVAADHNRPRRTGS